MADKLSPDQSCVSHTEGMKEVTLKCLYETSSRAIYLNWYRQYPDLEPHWLLYKGARSRSSFKSSEQRFTSNTGDTFTELIITDLTLADTALYYCALEHDAQ